MTYDTAKRHHCSVAAEHGIGCSKWNQLYGGRSASELYVIQAIKALLEPKNRLNSNNNFPQIHWPPADERPTFHFLQE